MRKFVHIDIVADDPRRAIGRLKGLFPIGS
jgi:hypothetical protein